MPFMSAHRPPELAICAGQTRIASVLPRLVAELARYIVDLDRDIKGSVMDSMLQASVKTYRKDPKTP